MASYEHLSETSLDSPALEPPSGITSDFAHPGGQHGIVYTVLIICAVLSTICMATRGYARWTRRLFRLQDALFLLSWIMYNGFIYVLYDFAIYPGFAVHQWNVPLGKLGSLNRLIWIGSIIYGFEMALIKSAILLDWIQLFSPTRQKTAMVRFIHCWIWANVVFFVVVTFSEMFQCHPTRKIWDPSFVGGKCIFDVGVLRVVSGIVNLVSDTIILVLPHKVVWSLQMSTRKKVGVSLLFAVGVFACISAAVRLYYSYQMAVSPDQLYTASLVGGWAMAELTAGFLVVGLPTVPKVVQIILRAKAVRSMLQGVRNVPRKDVVSKSSRDRYFRRRQTSYKTTGWMSKHDLGEHGCWYGNGYQELGTISKAVRISITIEPKVSEPAVKPSDW